MTPFQQLRIWARRASAVERATTAVAVAVAVALLGWLIAPVTSGTQASGSSAFDALSNGSGSTGGSSGTGGTSGTGGSTGTGATSGTGGSTGAGATSGTGGSTGTGATSGTGGSTGTGATSGTSGAGTTGTSGGGGTSGAGSTGSTGARSCPSATSGQGVTDTAINIAITLVDLAGAAGNSAVNVPTKEEQQKDWQMLVDQINKDGGAGCRHFVARFFPVNPLSSADQNQKCLDIVAAKPFLTIDLGALTDGGAGDCLPINKILLITQYATRDALQKYYPYYINPLGLQEDGYHNGYQAAKKNGYFTAAQGFKKLGVLSWSCRPKIVAVGRNEIRAAGVPDSQVTAYDLGCPSGSITPATDMQQAALTFKNAGVTHVTVLDANDYAGFTRAAAQQNYKPKYILAQDAEANESSGAFAPNAGNLDGALDVIGRRLGEAKTPNFKKSAATVKCDAIYLKNGQKSVYQQGAGYGGVACDDAWFMSNTLRNVTRFDRTAFAPAMHSLGVVDNSYPWGPVDFTVDPVGTPYGREQWRVDRFSGSCGCWQVLDATFHPAFK